MAKKSKTPQWALDRIQRWRETKSTKLDLSRYEYNNNNNISGFLDHLPPLRIIPSELQILSKVEQINELNLGFNEITELPPWFNNFQFLTNLDYSRNNLLQLPSNLKNSTNLTILDLTGNYLTYLPEWFQAMHSLTELVLNNNKFKELPNQLETLLKLRKLELRNLNLKTLPDWFNKFIDLRTLDLRSNELNFLPNSLNKLDNLNYLDISRNNLSSLPNWVQNFTNLVLLDLSENNLSFIPKWIKNLKNLSYFDASNNKINYLPHEFSYLENLSTLILHNNEFKKIPLQAIKLPNLNQLFLFSNPIEGVPLELWAGKSHPLNLEQLRNYLYQLEKEGTHHLFEAKLLVIGEGGAGKTSLARKLINPDYDLLPQENTTEGIDILEWHFTKDHIDYRINIWDFGGQEIYHATHKFFLTKNSLYTLVADSRKEDTDFNYWLHIQELLSKNSPLLLVKNEKQDRIREIDENILRGRFPNLKDSFSINLANNRGLDKFRNGIEQYIVNLPHIGTPLPKTWIVIREILEKNPANYISLEEYIKICKAKDYSYKDALFLSSTLHDLGVCLHFQDDPILHKTVILRPEWGTDAVYKVLDDKGVINRRGYFNQDHLSDIWSDSKYDGMHFDLLRLMLKFKLCYQIPGSENYIAPQLLGLNRPIYKWDDSDNLIRLYTYDFMPKGILTQFIVINHRLISDQSLTWKTGVILKHGNAQAEIIESYDHRQIKIKVAGNNKKELLAIISYTLDQIHSSYHNIKFTKWVPCNCEKCRILTNPHLYKEDVLLYFLQQGQESIQCHVSFLMVPILPLLDDIIKSHSDLRKLGLSNNENYIHNQEIMRKLSDIEKKLPSTETTLDDKETNTNNSKSEEPKKNLWGKTVDWWNSLQILAKLVVGFIIIIGMIFLYLKGSYILDSFGPDGPNFVRATETLLPTITPTITPPTPIP